MSLTVLTMLITNKRRFCLAIVLVTVGCAHTRPDPVGDSTEQSVGSDRIANITLLQINDVYEITAVEGGERGGLSRVATVRNRLLEENPNTLTVLSGDFLSPSALGTAKVDGERLAGKQMVAVLNAVGVDFVTFGNHEFDLDLEQLEARMAESEFAYVSGNVFDAEGRAFAGVDPYRVIQIPAPGGDTLRVGLIAVTAPLNPVDYVSYHDPIEVARRQAKMLRPDVEILIALTHMTLPMDIALAESVPELDLILGGHEHENIQLWRGPDLTPIVKGDANGRSVYVHRLRYDFATEKLELDIRLQLITDEIEDDSTTAAVVADWLDRAWDGFRASGFNPAAPVARTTEPLDGRESVIRNQPTELTRLIAASMRHAAGEVDVAMFNSGSVRLDDVLPSGRVTEYDVIRILPFGGEILTVEMTGGLLDSVLTQGVANRGEGGFLQLDGATQDDVIWFVNGEALLPNRKYRVAINDFLVSGYEQGFGFLTLDHPEIRRVAAHGDIRKAVIAELKQRGQ